MLERFSEFTNLFNMHKITYINESIDQIMKDFTCFLVTNDNHQNDAINRLKDHSDIIIIDNISNKEGEYLIICLKGTVIIISNSDFSLIQEDYINKSSFYNLCQYDYFVFADIILKSSDIDINTIEIFNINL